MERFKCVLFDLDGTLVSTGGAGVRALVSAFRSLFGIPDAMKGIQPAGKTDPVIIREIFKKTVKRNCTALEMRAVQEKYLEFLAGECDRARDYRVMQGIPDLLLKLTAMKVLLGLGTGNLERGARTKLSRGGLNPFFRFGGFGSDSEERHELLAAGRRKAEGLAGTQLRAKDVFIVGDTERDILAARKAGFPVIAVATGGTSVKTLKAHDPDFFLPNFENQEEFVRIILDGD